MNSSKYDLFDENFEMVLKNDDEYCDNDDFENESKKKVSNKLKKKKKLKAAWNDEDDDIKFNSNTKRRIQKLGIVKSRNELYKSHLVESFKSIHSNPKWSEIYDRSSSESDSDDDLIRIVGSSTQKSVTLEKHFLKFKKCNNLNIESRNYYPISSVQFHTQSTIALVSNKNEITLFDVINDNNPLQSVKFEDHKINRARFTSDGKEIIVGSDISYGHYYKIDLIKGSTSKFSLSRGKLKLGLSNFALSPDGQLLSFSGKHGDFFILSNECNEIIRELRVNERIHSLSFTKDSQKLLTFGEESKVYIFDTRQTKCIHSFIDEGCIHGCSLTTSTNEDYLVTGSKDGVVNIYDCQNAFKSEYPKPFKSLTNFKTSVHYLKFNHNSELMLMCSKNVENGARLVHFPSLSVFSNFPIPNFIHNKLTEGDFSPNSGFLALGNNQGSCFLFRLNHYSNY